MRFSAGVIAAALLLTTAGEGAASGVESWDLSRCLTEALASSPAIRAGGARVRAARAAADQSAAERLPVLAFRGGYRHATEVMSLDVPGVPLFPSGGLQFGDGNTYELALGVQAPLFTGGTLAGRARAEGAGWRASQASLAADSADVRYRVRRAYFHVLGADAGRGAAALARDRLERHYENVLSAVEIGAASREGAVQALSHLRKAEQLLIEAEETLRVARLALGEIVGSPGLEIHPDGDLDRSLLDDASALPGSVEAHPSLTSLDEQRERSLYLASAARGSLYPSLNAEAFYHYDKPGIDLIANEWMDYGTVGLALKWTLWDWRARSHGVSRAEAAAREIAERRAEVEDQLQTALAVARAHLDAAHARREKAEDRVRLEQERHRLVQSRYREAQATESELLDAEDDRTEAEVALAAATTQIRLAEAELLRVLAR